MTARDFTPIPLEQPFAVGLFAGVPAVPFVLQVAEQLGGRTFALEVRELARGPRATCSTCGAVYSTSSAAPTHPCHTIPPAPASSWDPGIKVLERRHRPRHLRGRPRTPHVLVSPPVGESLNRRRCFVCRKVLGGLAGTSSVIQVRVKGVELFFVRHPWCRVGGSR